MLLCLLATRMLTDCVQVEIVHTRADTFNERELNTVNEDKGSERLLEAMHHRISSCKYD